jgi:hypothetical protein
MKNKNKEDNKNVLLGLILTSVTKNTNTIAIVFIIEMNFGMI